VEADLARGLGLPVEDGPFAAACANARSQLAQLDAPATVTLRGDGTASVERVEGLDEQWQANENSHAALAALAVQRAEDERDRLAIEQIARERRQAEIAATGEEG
jgi:hypothetical protein